MQTILLLRSWGVRTPGRKKPASGSSKRVRRAGGRVTYTPEEEDGEYPVAALMYGKHYFPRIDITDVYLEEEESETYIMADGIDTDGDKRTGFQIYDEQLYDIALFLKWVL